MLRPAYPIETERLYLRPFLPSDLDAFLAMHGDPEVVRYLPFGVRGPDELRDVLAEKQRRTAIHKEGDPLNLAGVLKDRGELVGDFTLWVTSERHRQGEIGYILHPAHGGRGYATEGARAMLRIGFEQLRLHRICGRLDARNGASARVLERLGMRREAHFVENELLKGEWTDEVVYAMLGREWRLTRAPAPA